MRLLWGLGAVGGAVLACGVQAYTCESSAACSDGDRMGWCEPEGYCSFEDSECESGRRFGSQASDALAGKCVEPSDDDTTGSGQTDGTSGDAESDSGTTGGDDSDGDTISLDDDSDGDSEGETTDGGESDSSSSGDSGSSGGQPEADIVAQNYVFVTSQTYLPGSLQGLDGADAICNATAGDAGLPGTYVAWLSTVDIPAHERLGEPQGWANTSGLPFAANIDALLAYDFVYPIQLDEFGDVSATNTVVTGTTEDGELDTTDGSGDCDGWTSLVGAVRHGRRGALGNTWTSSFQGSCNTARHLYCFGVDDAAELPYTFPTGNRGAFVSNELLPATAGLDGFDNQCQLEAEIAGLPNADLFQALVATSTQRAIDRFDLDGPPWQVVGGGLVVEDASDLDTDDPTLVAPIHRGPDGVALINHWVWSGATSPSVLPADAPCSDWSSTMGTNATGASSRTSDWFAVNPNGCSTTRRVFCLENG